MGDPKKLKKKYSTPVHPWTKTSIDEERKVKREYGLKNKKELFRASSFLKKYKNLAKKLIANQTIQGEKEKKQILEKLQNLGLLSHGAKLDDILGLQTTDVLNRRLQSVIFRNGLAHSMKQSRQFITHRHITIEEKEITAPSYLVSLLEENKLGFKSKSALAAEDHPERVVEAAPVEVPAKEEDSKEDKPEDKKEAKKEEKKETKKEKVKKEVTEKKTEDKKVETVEEPKEKVEEEKKE